MSYKWVEVPLQILTQVPGEDQVALKEKIRQNKEERSNAPWRRKLCLRSSKYYRKLNKFGQYALHNSQKPQEIVDGHEVDPTPNP